MSDGDVGYEGKIGFNCPYCYYTALRPCFYYWHLAEDHAEHVRNGDVHKDAPYKGMAVMAVTRLQMLDERERRKTVLPPPMPDEVLAVPARIFGREVVAIAERFIPASWISPPDDARIDLSLGRMVYVLPTDFRGILTKFQKGEL